MKGQFDPMKNSHYFALVMWKNSPQGKWSENFKKQQQKSEHLSFLFNFY